MHFLFLCEYIKIAFDNHDIYSNILIQRCQSEVKKNTNVELERHTFQAQNMDKNEIFNIFMGQDY